MGIFFAYILKSSICLAVFYLFHRLLLSRETFHRFNRIALLCILLLAAFLPLVEVSLPRQAEVHNTVMTLDQWLSLVNAMESSSKSILPTNLTFTWIQVVLSLYLIGILFIVLYNSSSLFYLSKLLKSGDRYKLVLKDGTLVLVTIKGKGLVKTIPCGKIKTVSSVKYIRGTLIVHDLDIAPFSWMYFIVISRKDLEENGKEILVHELAHVRFCHSWDLLIADICIFVQWFNPASWLLKYELQSIHEYEADKMVLEEGVDARQYQLLLIKKAVGTRLYSMANNFNHSKLKKRISMMLKEESAPWNRLKIILILPLVAVVLVIFSQPKIAEKVTEVSDTKVGALASLVEARFSDNLVNASLGMKRMMVKKRKITDLKFELPTVSRISKEQKQNLEEVENTANGIAVRESSPSVSPIYLINNKEIKKEEINDLDPATIQSVDVLKGSKAIAHYGERGKNGVVILTLKGKSEVDKIAVKGVVQDEQGEPVAGATILLKGTNSETVTNAKGYFRVHVTEGTPLVISHINMKTAVVKATTQVVVTLKDE